MTKHAHTLTYSHTPTSYNFSAQIKTPSYGQIQKKNYLKCTKKQWSIFSQAQFRTSQDLQTLNTSIYAVFWNSPRPLLALCCRRCKLAINFAKCMTNLVCSFLGWLHCRYGKSFQIVINSGQNHSKLNPIRQNPQITSALSLNIMSCVFFNLRTVGSSAQPGEGAKGLKPPPLNQVKV